MPRVNGVMQLPPGSYGTPGTAIQSAKYNTAIDDFVADANDARPVTAGGTGATTASAARTNLGAAPLNDPTFTGRITTGVTYGTAGTISKAEANGAPLIVTGVGGGNGAFMGFARPGAFGAYFGLDTDSRLKFGGWSMGAVAYDIWNAGYQGPGTGMNADLLDGLHALDISAGLRAGHINGAGIDSIVTAQLLNSALSGYETPSRTGTYAGNRLVPVNEGAQPYSGSWRCLGVTSLTPSPNGVIGLFYRFA